MPRGITRTLLFCGLLLAFSAINKDASPQEIFSTDPLASWSDGPAKKAVIDFVHATTDKDSPKFVPASERIATFDNDGTLWVEQPMYAQLAFALERVKKMAPENPAWTSKDPFKAILTSDREAMAKFNKSDLLAIVGATHSGMTLEPFRQDCKTFIESAKHPRYKRLYSECIYQPMLEVMKYFRANGFKTYIVTGGGQEFVRSFSEPAYGIPREQVIGSAGKLKYEFKNGQPDMMKQAALLLLNDEVGKPEDIELFIGRKPLAAFGNSDGDREMLEWTQSGRGARLMMLIHHDDADREYAYGPESKIGTFSDALMADAAKRGWVVTSMKKDWKRIFPFEK